MKLVFTFFLTMNISFLIAQTGYYVDQINGLNTNDGTSAAAPLNDIDDVVDLVSEGDTIYIMGRYTNPSYDSMYTFVNHHDAHLWHSENSIRIAGLHGSENAYITITSYDSSTVLKGDGANIFRVQNCSYLRITDLEIVGEVENILLSTANAVQFAYLDGSTASNPPIASDIQFRDEDCVSNCVPNAVEEGEIYSDLDGVDVIRPSYVDTRGLYLSDVHHIDILNNHIHHMPGGGLRVSDCEDINIIGNEVNDCSRKSYSGTHGLVVTKATSTRSGNDYRINILKNEVHHNYNEQYSWAPSKVVITPHIDEGKGISLQRNETTSSVNWDNGRILVANNLCYFNGFSGVHSNDGNRIDMFNNTCYFNSYTLSITEGVTSNNGGNIGISANGGSNIRIANNISVIDSGLSKSAISSNIAAADGLVVKNNVIYGTTQAGVTSAINENANVASVQVNTQMADPLFVDPVNLDFNLQSTSPAINEANTNFAPTDDYTGATRDATPDIGAYEYIAPLPIDLVRFDAQLMENATVKLLWTTATEANNELFIVERSNDGFSWDELAKVSGNGNTSSISDYEIIDAQPVVGQRNYYRLLQVDFDGHINNLEVEDIFIVADSSAISLFPNPVSDILHIKGIRLNSGIRIYDLLGKEISLTNVITNSNEEGMTINVAHINSGIYSIIIDGERLGQLFVKE